MTQVPMLAQTYHRSLLRSDEGRFVNEELLVPAKGFSCRRNQGSDQVMRRMMMMMSRSVPSPMYIGTSFLIVGCLIVGWLRPP